MKSVIWVMLFTICLQFSTNEAFPFSLAAVGLGVVGLAGLKIYSIRKLLGPHQKMAIPAVPALHHTFTKGSASATALRAGQIRSSTGLQHGDSKLAAKSHIMASKLMPLAARLRRAASGSLQLNADLFRWLKNIDDEKCIHRFFCDLGVKPGSFGHVGRLAYMLLMTRVLPEESWPVRMHQLGRAQGQSACPSQCSEAKLNKTIAYLDRHIFEQTDMPIFTI